MYGVIINLGTNDWGQSLITREAFGNAYGAFLDGIPQSLKVACMSPIWTSTEGMLNQEGFTRADFRETVKEVCTARNRPTSMAWPRFPIHPPTSSTVSTRTTGGPG